MPASPSPPAGSKSSAEPTPIGCWFVPLLFVVLIGVGGGFWNTQPAVIPTAWANYEQPLQDNLANNVPNGLQLDFAHDGWIQQYTINNNSGGQFSWMFSYDANGVTAANFPAVPYLMAAGEFAFSDRDFLIVGAARLLLALALAFLINGVRLHFGWVASLIATLAVLADGAIFQATMYRSGDTIVAALITLAFLAFIHGVESVGRSKRSIWAWPLAGAFLGTTTLFSMATNLWLVLLLPIWMSYSASHWIRRKSWGLPAESFALFWIGVLVVAAPWWIRNCKVAGDLKPLGHFVGINLVGAYSDASLANWGNLQLDEIVFLRKRELFEFVPNNVFDMNAGDAELVDKEAYLAEFGSSEAIEWASDHATELPQLLIGRIGNHFGFGCWQSYLNETAEFNEHATFQAVEIAAFRAVILFGAFVGCFLSWRKWGGVIFVLIAVSTIVTAATWSDHGRQLIPLHALIDVAFAIGLVSLIGMVRSRSKPATKSKA